MSKYYVLFNPLANNGKGEETAKKLSEVMAGEELEYINVTEYDSYSKIVEKIEKDAIIVLAGGDGTINRFINDTVNVEYTQPVYYYPAGSGNDFLRDIDGETGEKPFEITKYLKDLPEVTVNGKTYKFLNGVGYGIDGYCCEEGDKQRAKSTKPVNYTAIAIKGLLFKFKPSTATVTVDGVKHTFKKAWIAPTMNGRYYGGGMFVAPEQDRLNADGKLSVVLMYGKGKIKTLMVFPSIFKGEHVKHTEMVAVLTGKEITVEFEKPCALQVDGETVLNVKSYSVKAGK